VPPQKCDQERAEQTEDAEEGSKETSNCKRDSVVAFVVFLII